MNKIILNHAAMHGRGNLSSLLLLVAGAVFYVGIFIYWQQLSSKVEQLNLTIQKLAQSQPSTVRHTLVKQDTAKAQEINSAIAEIVLPWNSVFKALEASNHDGIQMLAIEPNAKTRLVRIRAVAFDNDNMMRYLQNLNTQKGLRQVRLVSHEMVDINGHSAIELVAEALWKV